MSSDDIKPHIIIIKQRISVCCCQVNRYVYKRWSVSCEHEHPSRLVHFLCGSDLTSDKATVCLTQKENPRPPLTRPRQYRWSGTEKNKWLNCCFIVPYHSRCHWGRRSLVRTWVTDMGRAPLRRRSVRTLSRRLVHSFPCLFVSRAQWSWCFKGTSHPKTCFCPTGRKK